MVEGHGTARDHLDIPVGLLAQLHDGALAVIFLNLVDRRLEGFEFRRIHIHGLVFCFFRHSGLFGLNVKQFLIVHVRSFAPVSNFPKGNKYKHIF